MTDIKFLSREFCELAGICWHEIYPPSDSRYGFCRHCGKHRQEWDYKDNPDFTDAREVLDALGDDLEAFVVEKYYDRELPLNALMKLTVVVKDRTGLLLKEAVEFLRRENP